MLHDLIKEFRNKKMTIVKARIEDIRQSIISILENDPITMMTKECFFAYAYLLDILKIINSEQYKQYEQMAGVEILNILRTIKETGLYIKESSLNIDALLKYDLSYPIKSLDEIKKEISDMRVKAFSKHILCSSVKPVDPNIDLEVYVHKVKTNDNPISKIKIDVYVTYGILLHSGITDVYGHFQPFVVTALSADINEKINLSETGEDIIDQDEYTALLEAKKYIEQNYPKRTMMGFK